jgi:DNA-binding NtrC family response regulator
VAAYDWPGNVRELRNIIERALILGAADSVERLDLPVPPFSGGEGQAPSVEVPSGAVPPGDTTGDAGDSDAAGEAAGGGSGLLDRSGEPASRWHGFHLPEGGIVLEEVERDLLLQALEATRRNQTKSAEMLGLTRDALRYRMKKFGFME